MANLAHELGKGWGAVVLAGDIAKTALAFGLCGRSSPPWAACPACGPGWVRCWATISPSGGASGAERGWPSPAPPSSSSSPLWGTAACLSGLAVTLLSGWLPLGAVVIPALFVPPAFLCCGREAGLLALILALIMLSRTSGGWAASSGGRRNENSVAA